MFGSSCCSLVSCHVALPTFLSERGFPPPHLTNQSELGDLSECNTVPKDLQKSFSLHTDERGLLLPLDPIQHVFNTSIGPLVVQSYLKLAVECHEKSRT